jgi:hypothetical protein
VEGISWDNGPWSDGGMLERARALEESVSTKLSATPPWAAGLPSEALVARGEVPSLSRGRSMTFEARWRAVTMARLYSRCGWTYKRIGGHFGVRPERVRQLVRLTGYRGKRGQGRGA